MKILKDSLVIVWFYPDEPNFFSDTEISFHITVSRESYTHFINELDSLEVGESLGVRLESLPKGSPSHLDEASEIITDIRPLVFSKLIVKCLSIDKSCISVDNSKKEIEFCFIKSDIELLSNLIKRSIEEYGNLHGNYMNTVVCQETILNCELVIWGFHNNRPIYY